MDASRVQLSSGVMNLAAGGRALDRLLLRESSLRSAGAATTATVVLGRSREYGVWPFVGADGARGVKVGMAVVLCCLVMGGVV
jgi:hypothetical protein